MDGLEDHWQKLQLSLEEDKDIIIDENALEEGIGKVENSLIGKLHVEHPINNEVLCMTMMKAWTTSNSFMIRNLSSNIYVFSFERKMDKDNVMHSKPWLFDSHLFSLKAFNGLTPLEKIDFLKEIFWV